MFRCAIVNEDELPYAIKVSNDSTDEMFHWCSITSDHHEKYGATYVGENMVEFSFENEKTATVFTLKFGHL